MSKHLEFTMGFFFGEAALSLKLLDGRMNIEAKAEKKKRPEKSSIPYNLTGFVFCLSLHVVSSAAIVEVCLSEISVFH